MAITGYSIYRYKDRDDPNLSFDIVIFDSDSPQYPTESLFTSFIINTTKLKIPFGANNVAHGPTTTVQKNSKSRLKIYPGDNGTTLTWEYDGIIQTRMTSTSTPYAGKRTASMVVAYPVILRYNGNYFIDYNSTISFYNAASNNLNTIWGRGEACTYESVLPNQDKDIDPIYPWFCDGLNYVVLGSAISFQNYLNLWPDYHFDTSNITTLMSKIIGDSKPIDTHDPNPGGGDSKPGGGGGNGDIGGDTNPDDGLPTISALDSGLLTAYNPTVAELQSLGRFLWSDSFDISTFKKLFNDPFDTLLGLSVVPVKPSTSGAKSIMFGNMDSGVSAPVVSNQWVPKDMGSVTLKEVWRGALDYAPSTGVTIYLPFIGMRQLNVNDVMGSTLHLIYKFDVLTGACIAQIYVNHSSQGNKDDGFSWTKDQGLLYEFIGQCAENIPLASQDFTNTIRAAIGGVSVAAGAAASVATGNPALGMAALTVGMANAGMQASTPTVERGGHLSGSASIMGYSQPFLVVERPHQCKPSRYYALRGVPSQVYTSKLASCTGFTQITANNNLHIAGASDSELTELQNLLVDGVYFPDKKR